MSVCDHCLSDMDEPVEGTRGSYCSAQCYYAEEVDGPEAHDDSVDPAECPGCTVEEDSTGGEDR